MPDFSSPHRDAPSNVCKKDVRIAAHVTYDDDELEFLKAVEKWKRDNRRQYPSCTDILGIAYSLGYRKVKDTTNV